jgi:hypothetical protein
MVFGPALGGFIYKISPNVPMIGGAALLILVGVIFWFINIPDPVEITAEEQS